MDGIRINDQRLHSGEALSRIVDTIQDMCVFLESRAEQGKPIRPEHISDFAADFYSFLYLGCSAPPALERLFQGADSYLSREKMLKSSPQIVLYCMFSFAHYLFKAAASESEKIAEAEKANQELSRESLEQLRVERDPKLLKILQELDAHDDHSSARNQSELQELIGIRHTSQMSKYMSEKEKYGLWYTIRDGVAKLYFITDKGRRVLQMMREESAHRLVQGDGQYVARPISEQSTQDITDQKNIEEAAAMIKLFKANLASDIYDVPLSRLSDVFGKGLKPWMVLNNLNDAGDNKDEGLGFNIPVWKTSNNQENYRDYHSNADSSIDDKVSESYNPCSLFYDNKVNEMQPA